MKIDDIRKKLNHPDEGTEIEILSDKEDRIDAKITTKGKTVRVAFYVDKNGAVKQHVY